MRGRLTHQGAHDSSGGKVRHASLVMCGKKAGVGSIFSHAGTFRQVCSRQAIVCPRRAVVCARQAVVCARQAAVFARQAVVCPRQAIVRVRQAVVCTRQAVVPPGQAVLCARQAAVCARQAVVRSSITYAFRSGVVSVARPSGFRSADHQGSGVLPAPPMRPPCVMVMCMVRRTSAAWTRLWYGLSR